MLTNQPMKPDQLTEDAERSLRADGDSFHLNELRIALDPSHPAHSVPKINPGETVLDIGCGAGQVLIAACAYRKPGRGGLCTTCSRNDCPTWGYGIDVDEEALLLGNRWTRRMVLNTAKAERLPYADAQFDLIISRVALLFTELRESVAEMKRVLRPNGRIWVTVHTFDMVRSQWRRKNWKGLLYLAYVAVNGVYFHLTLKTFSMFGRRESWQSQSAMRRLLQNAGFRNIQMSCDKSRFLITAQL